MPLIPTLNPGQRNLGAYGHDVAAQWATVALAAAGDTAALRALAAAGRSLPSRAAADAAAAGNHLETLRWLLEHRSTKILRDDESLAHAAAIGGALDVIEWLLATAAGSHERLVIFVEAASAAAMYCREDTRVLEALHLAQYQIVDADFTALNVMPGVNIFSMDAKGPATGFGVHILAAEADNLAAYLWAQRTSGSPQSLGMAAIAARHGSMDVLRHLHEAGMAFDGKVYNAAMYSTRPFDARQATVDWLVSVGCPKPPDDNRPTISARLSSMFHRCSAKA